MLVLKMKVDKRATLYFNGEPLAVLKVIGTDPRNARIGIETESDRTLFILEKGQDGRHAEDSSVLPPENGC